MTDEENRPDVTLEALGISLLEEQAYMVLLKTDSATVKDIALALSMTSRHARQVLESIQVKGLITYASQAPRRYRAVPPELAIEALISQSKASLEQVRLRIPDLKRAAAKSAVMDDREGVVDVISDREVLRQILLQIHQMKKKDVIALQRAPVLFPGVNQQNMPSGLRVRSISDSSYLELPGSIQELRRVMKIGEEVRVFPHLPLKMIIVDRNIGIIPLSTDNPNGPTLLLRNSALLEALHAFFELLWAKSTPLTSNARTPDEAAVAADRMSDTNSQLITLLAAGLNDKMIAHKMNMSGSTLARRVADLMTSFDTRTRFQMGWRAALDSFEDTQDPSKRLPPKRRGSRVESRSSSK